MLRLTRDSLFDFVFAPDAPMVLEQNDEVREFVKRIDVFTERQVILKKRGNDRGRRPTIFMYPNSSATHQKKLQELGIRDYPLPEKYDEEPIELIDYVDLGQRMLPGDITFAWDPLIDTLLQDDSIVQLEGSEFPTTLSLYQHPFWERELSTHADAFVEMFVASWKICQREKLASWTSLLGSPGFLGSFQRGSGASGA